jgi:hypothetical protein
MPQHQTSAFSPGFRLSALDAVVLLAALIIESWAWWHGHDLLLLAGYVPLTFFLFCNVFRIARSLELIWAGTFALLAGLALTQGQPSIGAVLGISATLTVLLILIAMHRPDYHGVLWQWVNPKLPERWADTILNR